MMTDERLETTDLPLESTTLPRLTDEAPRCWRCKKKLAERASRPWEIKCDRCGARNAASCAMLGERVE